MTVVVQFLGVWWMYLLGLKFTVKTNNVDGIFFITQKKLSLQQYRWQKFLAEYDFVTQTGATQPSYGCT
jgi:hypothetical protein